MRSKFSLLIISALLLLSPSFGKAQMARVKTNANLYGQVLSKGAPVAYATIKVQGTMLGVGTDRKGRYRLLDLPEGTITLQVSSIGYRTQVRTVVMKADETQELNFNLEEDLLEVDKVVVTGDRTAIKRREASTIISTVNSKLLTSLSASAISEGLPYIPGVRMENNCQNCGFNQVRLNGMEGEYSQILVDGRPIFSGLLAVYGMELVPSNMIDRIEIQRGGGSALYGSNAIAGTVNLILKDPTVNSFQVGFTSDFTGTGIAGSGGMRPDNNAFFNATTITDDNRAGLTVFGNYRYRRPYDHNDDGFSELPQLKTGTLGARLYHRLGNRGKISATYFHIDEDRRGGNAFDLPVHEADVAENPKHNVNCVSATYTQMMRKDDLLSLNASMQHLKREAYYGGRQLDAYGLTRDLTFNAGAQYNTKFSTSTLITGLDFTTETLKDQKPGYTDIAGAPITQDEDGNNVVDMDNLSQTETLMINHQSSWTTGFFGQYSIKVSIATFTLGARFDYYFVKDHLGEMPDQKGFVPVPRASVLVNILPELQLRANYAMGYRAPQLYSEDLHVGVAGAKKILREIDPDLKRETSHSAMLSLDYNKQFDNLALGILVEGFYTHLLDAFITDAGEPDDDGNSIYVRTNNKYGARIMGANFEVNLAPIRTLAFKLGGTYQKSGYLKIEGLHNNGQKEFFRTPDFYGFLMADWEFYKGFDLDLSLNLTGPMKLAYEGPFAKNDAEQALMDRAEAGEDVPLPVRTTPFFADMTVKLSYTFNFKNTDLELFAGVKNLFNSYQNDFDKTAERDATYVYGPMRPRTAFVGIKLGNIF